MFSDHRAGLNTAGVSGIRCDEDRGDSGLSRVQDRGHYRGTKGETQASQTRGPWAGKLSSGAGAIRGRRAISLVPDAANKCQAGEHRRGEQQHRGSHVEGQLPAVRERVGNSGRAGWEARRFSSGARLPEESTDEISEHEDQTDAEGDDHHADGRAKTGKPTMASR
jgi:hypothetical protein